MSSDGYSLLSGAKKNCEQNGQGQASFEARKMLEIEEAVGMHLGQRSGMLTAGTVQEDDLSNGDETHFIINLDNGKTLGFCGQDDIKYADVVSGDEGFTMMVRLSGGRDAQIEPPFLVFMETDCNYPICGAPDEVAGVTSRTGPKGWMDTRVLPQWLSERSVIKPPPNCRRRVL